MCIDYFCSPLKYSVAPSVRVDCGFRPWIGVAFTWMSRHQPGGAPTTPEQRTTRTKHSHLHTEGFSPSCSCFYFRVSSDCCRLTGFCESGTRPDFQDQIARCQEARHARVCPNCHSCCCFPALIASFVKICEGLFLPKPAWSSCSLILPPPSFCTYIGGPASHLRWVSSPEWSQSTWTMILVVSWSFDFIQETQIKYRSTEVEGGPCTIRLRWLYRLVDIADNGSIQIIFSTLGYLWSSSLFSPVLVRPWSKAGEAKGATARSILQHQHCSSCRGTRHKFSCPRSCLLSRHPSLSPSLFG